MATCFGIESALPPALLYVNDIQCMVAAAHHQLVCTPQGCAAHDWPVTQLHQHACRAHRDKLMITAGSCSCNALTPVHKILCVHTAGKYRRFATVKVVAAVGVQVKVQGNTSDSEGGPEPVQ